MAEPVDIQALVAADLPAYKALRDTMLAAHPESFTSDAATEQKRSAESYLPRLGLAQAGGGSFMLGAWQAGQLVGTVGCERDTRVKVCHIGHLVGMMVRTELQGGGIGRRLFEAGIKAARSVEGMEMLTLTVTTSNTAAVRLYEHAGFIRFGTLPHAIQVDGRYHAKDHMYLTL